MPQKVVLITGSSSGFGYKTALKFARNGYKVYASLRDLKSEGAFALKEIVKNESLPVEIIALDVKDEKSVESATGTIIQKEKRIDILINNAGIGYFGPVEDFSIEEVKEQYEINVFGMLRMIKAVAPGMRENRTGHIINLSSINGLVPLPAVGVYSSSKFAIESLTEVLRFELSHFGIQVVLIEPGSFITGFVERLQQSKKSQHESSVYKKFNEHFFNQYYKAHEKVRDAVVTQDLLNAEKVANLIYQVAQEDDPQTRYRIGIDSHLYYWAKKFLPESIWEYILHKIYKW